MTDVWLAKGSEELFKDLLDSSENGEAVVVFSSIETVAAFSSLMATETFFVTSAPSTVPVESLTIWSSYQANE